MAWPENRAAPHRAVYTLVEVPPEEGWFSVDLFEHPGGVATGWASIASPGDVVGIMGPAGGAAPPGERLILAGDETALPAIRRILQGFTPDRRGAVLLEVDAPDLCVALPAPPRMAVTWAGTRRSSTGCARSARP